MQTTRFTENQIVLQPLHKIHTEKKVVKSAYKREAIDF